MGDTKEKILSILSAGCKVRVRFQVGEDVYQDMIVTYYSKVGGCLGGYFGGDNQIIDDIFEPDILEVIPPTLPVYNLEDLVMVQLLDQREGPFEIARIDQHVEGSEIYRLKEMGGFYDRSHICPYHEGVQYNPTKACEACGGDGIEKCNNPDHGLIDGIIRGLGNVHGCPVCGFDDKCRVPSRDGGWLQCETCKGSGVQYNPLPDRVSDAI